MSTDRSTDIAQYADELFESAKGVDLLATIERLYGEPDPERAAQLFGQLSKRFYAREKSLARSSAIARAGIQYCLSYTGDESTRSKLRQSAKALAFNTAANSWPGWDEEGIVITASDLELGLDAARLNARLARELHKGPLAESKAHWLLGAMWLARRERDLARQEFGLARERARAAENADDEQMNAGYEALVGILQGEASARAELARIVDALCAAEASEDAKFYGKQLPAVLEIFQRA